MRVLGKIIRNEPLARYTSFRIGGPASFLLRAESLRELEEGVRLAEEREIPWVILGGGTNVLVADEGFPGLVIINACDGFELEEVGEKAVLKAEGGAPLARLARLTARKGWGGLEWAEGIPGTIGGAIAGNAGAFGGCIAGVLKEVTVLLKGGEKALFQPEELDFSYRHSAFKGPLKGSVILEAQLSLSRAEASDLAKKILQYHRERKAKQPSEPSAGSVFKNPPGHYAAKLIEEVGLKGFRIGGACFSPVHANFIVNLGRARACDVLCLMELAVERVYKEAGIKLEPELEFIGLNPPWS